METVTNVKDLRAHVAAWRRAGETVGFVPTMGALHDGHMSLVAASTATCARSVASIFVNPTQFGPNEDLSRYPRREEEDAAMLAAAGCDLLFLPSPEEMYPEGYGTSVSVAGLGDVLCGASRPGHFDGVATVVSKLFNQVRPDHAFFGEKDGQQLAIIRRLVLDLDFPVQIHGVPTAREEDGLARSSRNLYLSPEERSAAALFPKALREAATRLGRGADVDATLDAARRQLAAGGLEPDYVEFRDGLTLAPQDEVTETSRLFAAVRVGTTRLIDNISAAS